MLLGGTHYFFDCTLARLSGILFVYYVAWFTDSEAAFITQTEMGSCSKFLLGN